MLGSSGSHIDPATGHLSEKTRIRADKHGVFSYTLLTLLCLLGARLPAASFDIQPPRLPPAYLGRPYAGGPLVATWGGLCPSHSVSLQVAGGLLPEGLTLSPAGYFFGVPSAPGNYRFLIRASNACGWSDQEYRLEVTGAPILAVNPAVLDYRILEGQAIPQPVLLRVSSSTASVPYRIEPQEATWLHARPRSGVTPPPGAAFDADIVELFIDTTRLRQGTHRSELRFGAWRAVEAPVVPVSVTVLGQRVAAGGEFASPGSFGQEVVPPAIPAPSVREPHSPAVPADSLPAAAHVNPQPVGVPKAASAARYRKPVRSRVRPVRVSAKPVAAPASSAAEQTKPSPVGKPVDTKRAVPATSHAPKPESHKPENDKAQKGEAPKADSLGKSDGHGQKKEDTHGAKPGPKSSH